MYLERELFIEGANLRQDSHVESTHRKQQIGIILRIHRNERILPLNRRHRTWQAILDVPKHRSTEIDVVLHESHAGVAWPALLVVVTDDVFVVRVGMLGQVTLNEFLKV